jgi:hypothetical protein
MELDYRYLRNLNVKHILVKASWVGKILAVPENNARY